MQDKRDMKFKKKREYSASYIYLMSQWERQRSHNSHDDVTELYKPYKRFHKSNILNESSANSEFNQCLTQQDLFKPDFQFYTNKICKSIKNSNKFGDNVKA